MKKVLHVVEAFAGGIFSYLTELANGMSDTYEIYIAYSKRKQTPDNFEDYFNENIHFIEVKNFTRELNPIKDFKAFWEIREIAKNIQPDIIHLHSSKAGALGRFAFDGRKMKIYYTPHGYSFLMENCSRKKRMIYKEIEKICGYRNCTTISCSIGEHNESEKLTKKAKYVNNGINIKELNELLLKTKNQEHELTVFTLGRISYQKNPMMFNEVASMNKDIRFIWIGDGELRNVLTSENIEITGWLNRVDALSIAVNADIFILTSLWEGLPISLLEAMYMKKLCVVSDVIGSRDVINNGRNGFVCNDAMGFSKAIRCNDKQLVENAYNDIISEYNTEKMTLMYKEIYEE